MTLNEPMPLLIQGDARRLPLADESVDLVVTSPPYWSLRSYSDGGQHYDGQIGSEPTWQEYLDNLIECTREMMRVLKPSGSIWLNLGDKYSTGNSGESGMAKLGEQYRGGGKSETKAKQRAGRVPGMPSKSLLLLPHRYAIRCVDELGLILRQDQVWDKPNGLPESVTDRTRRSHEYLFHMVKSSRYYSALDEIREEHAPAGLARRAYKFSVKDTQRASKNPVINGDGDRPANPLGKLPGSTWSIPSQPLNVPDHISHTRCCGGQKRDGCEKGLDHYAAFPFALVRPIILGWSPREVCTACGEGRRPVADRSEKSLHRPSGVNAIGKNFEHHGGAARAKSSIGNVFTVHRVTGYACGCADTAALVRPGVVLDPFGGTASAPLVAAMNGRTGISIDASWDYGDIIASWRIHDPKERARAAGLDPDAVARIPVVAAAQGSLWDDLNGSVS